MVTFYLVFYKRDLKKNALKGDCGGTGEQFIFTGFCDVTDPVEYESRIIQYSQLPVFPSSIYLLKH